MSGTDLLAIVLIALVVLDWLATRILWLGARRLKYPALSERAGVSVQLSTLASGLAILSVLYLLGVKTPPIVSAAIIIAVFLGVSLPQVVWVIQYIRGVFDDPSRGRK